MLKHPERSVWDLVDAVSILFIHAYATARARLSDHPSEISRLLAQRDHAHTEAALLERELAIFRSHRQNRPPKRRLFYTPQERAEILQLVRLRGWSANEAAARFVVHPNTIRNWRKAQREMLKSDSALGSPPWNRLHAGVRWLVHEIRAVCPERDFGTRTIARHIMRAGVQISRASVRRILEEGPPKHPGRYVRPPFDPVRTAPDHFFSPPRLNHVWHMDMTVLHVLWKRCEVAAIIDGFSRKIVGLKIFYGSPTTEEALALFDDAVKNNGAPEFLITDRGAQFQGVFRTAVRRRGVRHARGKARTWQFNAKVERLFWSLKRWWRVSLIAPSIPAVQKRLDAYAAWHNLHRPHESLGTMTPVEAAAGITVPPPLRYTEGGDLDLRVAVTRRHVGGDPKLAYPAITVTPKHRSVA